MRPMRRMAPRISRGTIRFGSLVSSASGAAPSHPVKAKIENTIARYRPLPLGAFAGLKEDKLTPPGPGEKNPQVASNTTQPTSRIPRITHAAAETSTPRYVTKAVNAVPISKNNHHGKEMPYCDLRSPHCAQARQIPRVWADPPWLPRLPTQSLPPRESGCEGCQLVYAIPFPSVSGLRGRNARACLIVGISHDGGLSLDSAVHRLFASWRVAGQLFWSVE
jgi:hypothetical protein